jgi:hypothetical protein
VVGKADCIIPDFYFFIKTHCIIDLSERDDNCTNHNVLCSVVPDHVVLAGLLLISRITIQIQSSFIDHFKQVVFLFFAF